jgi:hypothetical protein
MTDKRLTIIMHGADRELWRGGQLRVTVTDIFAAGGPRQFRSSKVAGPIFNLDLQLPFDAGQVYGIAVRATKHRTAFYLVRRQDFIQGPDGIETASVIVSLMLVPEKPTSSDLVGGHARLEAIGSPIVAPGGGVSALAFSLLESEARMALLNLEAKLGATLLDGSSLLSFVAGVRHVAVDRLFLFMRAGAKEAVSRSRDFAGAPGHKAPASPTGLPDHPDSFKHTRFGEGNIQLSFSAAAEPVAGGAGSSVLCHSVDIDIDLANGLSHVVEFLENNVFRPGQTTDQTLVYALLFNQQIVPQYTLDPIDVSARSRAVPRAVQRRGPSGRRKPSPKRRAGQRDRRTV